MGEVEVPPLVLDAVNVRYGSAVAVESASLEAYSGEFIAVTGHSGAGKSSLLWAVAGAVAAGGSVRLGDEQVRDRDHAASLGIEVIPQGSALALLLSARENVELPLLAKGLSVHDARRRAEEALASVGLEESGSHLAEELSGGQQQRVAVARGLALGGRVLLADEPTSELDQGNVSVVLDALRAEAERGCVVVIATHDPAIVDLADHHVAIDEGRLV